MGFGRIVNMSVAEPFEYGNLITYLCGNQSGFMTGHNTVIDGDVYRGLF